MKKNRTALTVVAIDGISTTKTGVGNVVFNFFDAFEDIRKSSWFEHRSLSLIALTPRIQTPSDDLNLERYEKITQICRSNNGFVDKLSSFNISHLQADLWTGGKVDTLDKWHSLALAAASKLDVLALQYDEVFAILHDAPFCLVRNYLNAENVKLMWMSHGLGKVFNDEWENQRKMAESTGIPTLIKHRDLFACISEKLNEKLSDSYSVPNNLLVNLVNEYHPIDVKPDTKALRRIDEIKQKSFGKKIIFSWGRCCYQKGFDIVVPALKSFLETQSGSEFFCVLLIPMGTGEEHYGTKILSEIAQINPDKLYCVTEFDEYLPKLVLELGNLDAVIFGSRFEGFSLTCLEALALSHSQTKFIFNNISAYEEVFKNVENAFQLPLFEESAIVHCLHTLANTDTPQKQREYRKSFTQSYISAFDSFLP